MAQGNVIYFEPGDATRYRVGLFPLPKPEDKPPRFCYCFGVGDAPMAALTPLSGEALEYGYWASKLVDFEADKRSRRWSLSALMHTWGALSGKEPWGSGLKPLTEMGWKEGWELPLIQLAQQAGLIDTG
jgi:hypothetical protein